MLLTLLFALTAGAQDLPSIRKAALEAQNTCGTFVRFDEQNLYLGFGAYKRGVEDPRLPIPASLRVASLQAPADFFTLQTLDAAIDIVTEGNTAFVLTFSAIEEWDLATRTRVATFPTSQPPGATDEKEHAQAMARAGNFLVIAHGRLGISFFDITARRVSKQFRLLERQLPLESMATGIAVRGDLAYVTMDNFSLVRPGEKPPFRGLVVVDLRSQAVAAELSGLDPGADAIAAFGDRLFVSYGGMPLWKYGNVLGGRALPSPLLYLWKYPVEGRPTGKAFVDEEHYYTCFMHAPRYRGENGGFYRPRPMALDRKVLQLD